MHNKESIVIHIGLHKTGSTSIQAFLGHFRERLRSLDVEFYTGMYQKNNHVELHAASMRKSRDSPFKRKSKLVVDANFRAMVQRIVGYTIARSPCRTFLFSAEGLSYLKYDDEFIRLKQLFPSGTFRLIGYRRNLAAYRVSYTAEMTKHNIISSNSDSVGNLSPDSWLWQLDQRISLFKHAFGSDSVTILDYDREVDRAGSILPSFLHAINLGTSFHENDWASFRRNVRPPEGSSQAQ